MEQFTDTNCTNCDRTIRIYAVAKFNGSIKCDFQQFYKDLIQL